MFQQLERLLQRPRPHPSLAKGINKSQHVPTVREFCCHRSVRPVRKATERNGYRATGPGERVGSVNKRSSHHRVVSGSGQLHEHDAQTSTPRPRRSTCMEKLRKPFLTQPNQHVPTVAVNVGPINISTVAPQTSQHFNKCSNSQREIHQNI